MKNKKLTRRTLHKFFGVTALALLAPVCVTPALAQTGRSLRIGIIGSGNIGGAVGLRWAAAGHQILFSSRNPEELAPLVAEAGPLARAGYPQEAAEFGEVVFIAVPYSAMPQIGADYGPLMQGKIVIDCSNPYPRRDGDMAIAVREKGTGLATAEFIPGVRLARAFNAIGFRSVTAKAGVRNAQGELVAIPVAGDDPEAVAMASNLVIDAGFEPVVVGGLEAAKRFDPDTPVYVQDLTARELRAALGL